MMSDRRGFTVLFLILLFGLLWTLWIFWPMVGCEGEAVRGAIRMKCLAVP